MTGLTLTMRVTWLDHFVLFEIAPESTKGWTFAVEIPGEAWQV